MKKRRMISTMISVVMMLAVIMGSLCLTSCDMKETTENTPLTMYVGLGNTRTDYYPTIHEMILEETGIDVKFVYNNTLDTSNAIHNRMKANDLPADIIVTAMTYDNEAMEAAFLDLASCTNLPELFRTTEIQELSRNGKIYQLPFSTRLIGIEYNQTLMDEMGWELPQNFDDMLALKEKADEAGICFAVSGGTATGHGFNYLFHLMGTDFLVTPDGSEWYEKFMNGEADIEEFREQALYFKKFADAGLFGEFHDEDWSAADDFKSDRALFYFNILNDAVSDEGGDVYKAMPWISENGASNCFTMYNNMYLALDKRLGEPENASLLEKALKVMEYMTTEEITTVFKAMYQDGYVAVNDFEIDDSRMYSPYKDQIKSGYTMHWYYNDFDNDSIMSVGQLVNDYIKGDRGVEFDDIMKELEIRRDNHIHGTVDVLTTAEKTFSYEKAAELQAVAGAVSAQKALQENGYSEEINVSLIPYTDDLGKIEIGKQTAVVQEKIYEGEVETSKIRSYIAPGCNNVSVIEMTGQEINDLVNVGWNGFSYVLKIKGEMKINSSETYIVAVSEGCLPEGMFEEYLEKGKVFMNQSGDGTISGTIEAGLTDYCEAYSEITPDHIEWK